MLYNQQGEAMFNVALFGAGKIGEAICGLLTLSGRYKVRVCDKDLERAKKISSMWQGAEALQLKLEDEAATAQLLHGCDAVISALPFHCNIPVAKIAVQQKVHYFDLTEDVATTRAVTALSKDGPTVAMPQCGLAPGFISIAAMHLAKMFDTIETVKLRVGALPIYPSNRLKYNLTWSTEGLINEYANVCEAIQAGNRVQTLPLEGLESFSLDGAEYEAFNTSGGLGSLADTLASKVHNLDYKTVRYPGHRDLIAFLMQDLRFTDDRETLARVFERSISFTPQDKCLIFVTATGTFKHKLVQRTYASTVYNTTVGGNHFGAIQVTTASGICAPMDLFLTGKLGARKGIIRLEDVPLVDFLDNEFGKYYRDERALQGIAA